MRAQLGLKPLAVSAASTSSKAKSKAKQEHGGDDRKKSLEAALQNRVEAARKARLAAAAARSGGSSFLSEGGIGDDDNAGSSARDWVRSTAGKLNTAPGSGAPMSRAEQKALALARAKALAEQEGGIGDSSDDDDDGDGDDEANALLAGLKVKHDLGSAVAEGEEMVLTLADTAVIDGGRKVGKGKAGGNVLENASLSAVQDAARAERKRKAAKAALAGNPYEQDEIRGGKGGMLAQYDEDDDSDDDDDQATTVHVTASGFRLSAKDAGKGSGADGVGGVGQADGKVRYDISSGVASEPMKETLTAEEASKLFRGSSKKKKKKKDKGKTSTDGKSKSKKSRSMRTKSSAEVDADDEQQPQGGSDDVAMTDVAGHVGQEPVEMKAEDADADGNAFAKALLMRAAAAKETRVKVEDETAEAEEAVAAAIKSESKGVELAASSLEEMPMTADDGEGERVVFSSASEFVRGIGTKGRADDASSDDDDDEDDDDEAGTMVSAVPRAPKAAPASAIVGGGRDEGEDGGVMEMVVEDQPRSNVKKSADALHTGAILGTEGDIASSRRAEAGGGIASALRAFRNSGLLETRRIGRNQDQRAERIAAAQARGEGEDEEGGPLIEYRDEHGRLLTKREAYREQSRVFHGVGPKARNKARYEKKVHETLAGDGAAQGAGNARTLSTLNKITQRTHQPFMVVGGIGAAEALPISNGLLRAKRSAADGGNGGPASKKPKN